MKTTGFRTRGWTAATVDTLYRGSTPRIVSRSVCWTRFARPCLLLMLLSGLPEAVADEEDLARFLTARGHFNSTMVRPAAFLPNPADRKKSVCRHGREPLAGLWLLAREYLPVETKLYGAGICSAGDVRASKLQVEASEPPRRHADILGFPTNEDPDLQKAAERERAIQLASKCGPPILYEPAS